MTKAHTLCCFAYVTGALLIPSPAGAQLPGSLANQIEAILHAAPQSNAWWGVSVADEETGEVLYELNANMSMVPASVTKLFTTAAALDYLGPSFQYKTRLYASGPLRDGTLQGDLIVRGAGDPTMGIEPSNRGPIAPFVDWRDSLRTSGIKLISGNIIGDDDVFSDQAWGSDWAWDDLVYGYAAETSGLSFHDNAITLRLHAHTLGEPTFLAWEPKGSGYLRFMNHSLTTAHGTRTRDGYRRHPRSNRIEVTARIPVGSLDSVKLSVPNPTLFFVTTLKEVVTAGGLQVIGSAVDVDSLDAKPDYASQDLRLVATWDSPPLSAMVREINTNSNNMWAEAVLRTASGDEPYTTAASLKRGKTFYAAAGIDTSRLQLIDGSGLSRKNLVTPRMVTMLLQHMAHHPDLEIRHAFQESLAIGGRDGSLKHRFSDTNINVRAKTGTLGNVSGLAGTVTTESGRRLNFALLCNHYTIGTRRIRQTQDAVVALLAAVVR